MVSSSHHIRALVNDNRSLTDVMTNAPYDDLVRKRQEADEQGQKDFHYFNDQEILAYYLHHNHNVDQSKGRSKRTVQSYQSELFMFIEHIMTYSQDIGIHFAHAQPGSLFRSLSASDIEKYQEWLIHEYPNIIGRNSDYSPATIARKSTIIKNFLRFLYHNGYIEKDIARFMKAATVNRDERPNRDLGLHEVKGILDYFSKEVDHPVMFGIVHLLVTTGMRNEELCRATIGDIEYDHDRERYYLHITGKGNKKRIVPLHEAVMKSINRFRFVRGVPTIEASTDDMPLIVSSTGRAYSPSYLSQYFTRVIQRANLSFLKGKTVTPHSFRHAFAILSYREGVDIYTIMRSLGHEKIETTEIYLPKEMEKDEHASLKWSFSDFAGPY